MESTPYLIEEQSSSLISENLLAVAAAAAWLGVGFVMVVAVACCARGAPAWGVPRLVRSLLRSCHPGCMHVLHQSKDYELAISFTKCQLVCILLVQVHHWYTHTVAPREPQ